MYTYYHSFIYLDNKMWHKIVTLFEINKKVFYVLTFNHKTKFSFLNIFQICNEEKY